MLSEKIQDDARHGIGGNNPPSDIEVFGDRMKEVYEDNFNFAEKLLAAEERIPAAVDNDIDAGKLGDYIKQLKNCDKSLNAARESEKEVYLKGTRMVDGFFNSYREKLKKLVEKAAQPLAEYQKRKEDEERRRREEEAEKKRLEAEAALRDAERKRKEAEEKERIAKEEAAKAAAEADRKRKEIEERAAAEKAEQQREIDRLNAEKAAAEKADKEKQAELKRQLDEANEKLKATKANEKAELKEVKADLEAHEDAAHELAKQAKADHRESNKLVDTAVRADKQATKLDALAEKSAAELSRVRGLEGSVATVSTMWVGDVIDREALDKAALWPHLKAEDIQIALNSWVKANPGQQMPGAFIREETKAVVR